MKAEEQTLVEHPQTRSRTSHSGSQRPEESGRLSRWIVHAIARAHGCTSDDVRLALDRHPVELNLDKYLKRTLALVLMRLDQLDVAFEGNAGVTRMFSEKVSGLPPRGA